MLEIIVKRDGQEEVATPRKANAWAAWSMVGLEGRVDWSSIVMAVMKEAPAKMTSQEFTLALANKCLTFKDWPHNKMAGKLFAVWHWKKLYPNGFVSVHDQQKRLADMGVMKPLAYTDTEYEAIEQIVDHKRDLDYAHFQIKQDIYKYGLRNRVTDELYETPQYMYIRMAMALSEELPADQRLPAVFSYYHDLSSGKVNAPTPNYNNLGTHHRGFSSCCLFSTDDTKESIGVGNHIAYTMTYMSAGIGNIMHLRSIGDPVQGGYIRHEGKKPYFSPFGKLVLSNIRAGRGGAANQYFTIFDPEAEQLILCQNPTTPVALQNRDTHFTVLYNSFFVKLAAKKQQYFTFNAYTAPDLYQALFSADKDKFIELYTKYEMDESFVKNWKSAWDMGVLMENQGHEVSTLYSLNIEEVNRHTSFLEPLTSSNLCVAPETQVLTDRGHFPIAGMVGMKVNVWNGSEFSEVTIEQTSPGAKLITVTLDDGRELTCTPEHKFYVQTGYGEGQVLEVRAGQLIAGQALIKGDLPVIEGEQELHQAYINGFYTGDGCDTPQGQRIYLYGQKQHLQTEFSYCGKWTVQPEHDRRYTHYNDLAPKYFVPDARYSISSRLEWLAGLGDADGTIYRNGDNEQLVVGSSNRDFLRHLADMLQTLGVNAKIKLAREAGEYAMPTHTDEGSKLYQCAAHYRLLVNSYDLHKLVLLGLRFRRLQVTGRQPQRSAAQFARVVSVEDHGRFDATYCFTEPKRHLGVFNGILTGQCLEIAQVHKPYSNILDLYTTDHHRGEISLCNLAAVNVGKDLTDAEYERVAESAVRMADTTIDLNEYVFPHLEYTAKQRRNIAIGLIGVAEYMARHQLRYDTPEGLKALDYLGQRHFYFVLKASLKLGKELGNAPWMNKTKWPKGWLPIDTYNKNVDKLVPHVLYFDFESLRAEIIENGGIRNSALVAHMPTESSSKASGTTNGLYPVRALDLKKTDYGNALDWVPPDSDILADHYQIAYDIETRAMIHCYAVVQKWTDQLISADYYKDRIKYRKLTQEELIGDLVERTRYGTPSKYYQNSLTPVEELATLKSSHEAVSADVAAQAVIDAAMRRGPAACGDGGCTL